MNRAGRSLPAAVVHGPPAAVVHGLAAAGYAAGRRGRTVYPMGRLILGVIAAIIAVMVILAIIHVVIFYAFIIAVIAAVAFGVFRLGRWSGRKGARQREPW